MKITFAIRYRDDPGDRWYIVEATDGVKTWEADRFRDRYDAEAFVAWLEGTPSSLNNRPDKEET